MRAAVRRRADEAVVSPEERIFDCDRMPACTDKEVSTLKGKYHDTNVVSTHLKHPCIPRRLDGVSVPYWD